MTPQFYLGQTVKVFKYGSWYQGRVVKVGRTRVEVTFVTKSGKPKRQFFNMAEHWSIKGF